MCTAAHGIVNTQLLLQTTEEKAVSETQQQHQQKKSEGRSFDVEGTLTFTFLFLTFFFLLYPPCLIINSSHLFLFL